ncbi:MAG: hypothetical protein IPM57_12465 [Oligoflexia bacterium]|nr:hypothetical protein [Oligoflexia bacterium]
MRTGRYKKNYIEEANLGPIAQKLKPRLEALRASWRENKISNAEYVAQFILNWHQAVMGKNSKGSRHNLFSNEVVTALEPGLQFFAQHTLKAVPIAVNRSLVFWAQGKYPLELFERPLEVMEVLEMQTQGKRCVSVITNSENYILGERDPLSFVIHDLIHADHFFTNDEQAQGQIRFSKICWQLSHMAEFEELLKDEQFKKDFDYVSADMNSHEAHLHQTLEAIIKDACTRKHVDSESYMEKVKELQFGLF